MIQNNRLECARIHLKMEQIDLQRSARISKDSLKTLANCSAMISLELQRFAQTQAKCHASEGQV